MIDNKYSELMEKIRVTGDYVSTLARVESNMNDDVEENNIDIKVKDILSKCIDDINLIYVTTPNANNDDWNDNSHLDNDRIKELQGQNTCLIDELERTKDEREQAVDEVKELKDAEKGLIDRWEGLVKKREKDIAWLCELMIDIHFNGYAMEPEQDEEFDRLNDKYNLEPAINEYRSCNDEYRKKLEEDRDEHEPSMNESVYKALNDKRSK